MSPKAAFIYSDDLTRHLLRDDHPLKSVRLRNTYDLLCSYGAFSSRESTLVEPRMATEKELLTFQTLDYLEAVKSFSRDEQLYVPSKYNLGKAGDNPIYSGMYEAAVLSTGASLVAAELVADKVVETAFSISGGLHHAASGNASGFCVFNDPVIAINHFLSRGLKVAYVDVDAHHGDGVQNAFIDTRDVLTISIHESGTFLFPGTGFVEEMGNGNGEGYSVNVPLYPYTGDEVYLWVFREIVPPLVNAFKPDVLVTQLGVDSYHSDPLTHLGLTSIGFIGVVSEFAQFKLPWLALGGGGYDISAVSRCWTLAYGVMTEQQYPDEIPRTQRGRHGRIKLRDSEQSVGFDGFDLDVRRQAEDSVDLVKRLIFPAHDLT